MTEETKPEEVEVYTPQPITLMDGDALIFDPDDFAETFDAHAVIHRDGCLFVLCRETLDWKKVEPHKAAKPSVVKPIK